MVRRTLVVMGIVLGTVGLIAAQHDEKRRTPKTMVVQDIVEKVDGKKTKATTVVFTLKPGEAGAPHRHPGPAFGYILEGEYEWAINDEPSKILKVGETFYEPTGSLHRVSKNPSKTSKTRVLAMVLHPADAKSLVIPEKSKPEE